MNPVFRYRWQQWIFGLTLGFFLALPVLPKPEWMDRSVLYLAYMASSGEYGYFADHLLQEKGDIDILFLGPSSIGASINTRTIKSALWPILKREPIVYTASHIDWGADYDYITLVDILRKRRVKLLVLASRLNIPNPNKVHAFSNYLWDMNLQWPALKQLSFSMQSSSYFFSVMAGIRLLMAPFKDRLPPVTLDRCINLEFYFGGCLRWQNRRDLANSMPPFPRLPIEQLIHYRNTSPYLLAKEARAMHYEQVFSDAILTLAKQNDISVVYLEIPNNVSITPMYKIPIPHLNKNQLGLNIPVIGVTTQLLFPGLSAKDIMQRYFIDSANLLQHMHYAAAEYFTRTIAPAIIQSYMQAEAQNPASDIPY